MIFDSVTSSNMHRDHTISPAKLLHVRIEISFDPRDDAEDVLHHLRRPPLVAVGYQRAVLWWARVECGIVEKWVRVCNPDLWVTLGNPLLHPRVKLPALLQLAYSDERKSFV